MIAVIVNKGSGPGGDHLAQVTEAFADLHADVFFKTADGSALLQATRDAVANGADVVVAAGGDGTVNAVASVLVGSKVRMGVLPMGTLNHFAKDAGIPLDLKTAAKNIVHGSARALDVASVNGHIFINNSSIGLYPLMVRDRDKQRSRFKRSKWWAMIRAGTAIFKRHPTFSVRLTMDGGMVEYNTPAVFVGNNIYQLEGLTFGERTAMDAGLICVFAVKTRTRWQTLGLAFRALLLRNMDSEFFEVACTQELLLETDVRSVDVSLDGEVIRMQTPLHYTVLKRSLRVIVPQPSIHTDSAA